MFFWGSREWYVINSMLRGCGVLKHLFWRSIGEIVLMKRAAGFGVVISICLGAEVKLFGVMKVLLGILSFCNGVFC